MPKFYKKADAFLITMVNNEVVNNTLPAKVQSYMVAGKPIIGAISGEVKRVIEDADCGLCCESLDYKELAKLIKKASKSKKDLEKWSTNSNEYYKKYFAKDKCITELEKIFKKLI
jgi:glycosyltransferase involved in cell wall biosynthesis